MMKNSVWFLGLLALFAGLFTPCAAQAAVAEVVGVLDLATKEDVVVQLKLTSEQKNKLSDLIDQRESEASGLASEFRELNAKDRAEKIAAFRKESETQGLALLTSDQRSKLEQIRLRRLGYAAMAESAVLEKFNLSDAQKKDVAAILEQREKDLVKADEKSARLIQAQIDQKLAAVLDEKQKSTWENLTGGSAPRVEPVNNAEIKTAKAAPPEPTPEKMPPKIGDPAATPAMTYSPQSFGPPGGGNGAKPPMFGPGPMFQREKTPGKEPAINADPLSTQSSTTPPLQNGDGNVAREPRKPAEKLRFNFRYAPWKNVMDWFAEQAGMSLVMDAPPPGTFNYTDDREYTPAEAIDIVNTALMMKGYMLIRRDRMLIVVNKADGIPPGLVQTITPDQLEKRGEFEIVCVLFNLDKLAPEEAEVEVKKLLGPEGSIVSLPKSRQILVTDTGGRLKAIRSLINRVEDPQNVLSGQIRTITLKVPAEQLLPIVRSMLDFPEDKNVSIDGSLRLAVDPSGKRIFAQGKPEKLSRLEEILQVVNVEQPGSPHVGISTTPQIENYPITSADPQTVFQVLQTLMQGLPDVRLALDSKNNNIVAQARPAEQATIKATIDQLQRDSRRPEVFRLQSVDPQLALAAINKRFGITSDAKTTPVSAPQVDVDPTTRQLIVQGTDLQIKEIKLLLEKLGETDLTSASAANPSKVRMLSISPRSARSILDQIQGVWPATHKNKIRELTPSDAIPAFSPNQSETPTTIPQRTIDRLHDDSPRGSEPPRNFVPPQRPALPGGIVPSGSEPDNTRKSPPASAEEPNRTASADDVKIRFIADEIPAMPPTAESSRPSAISPENLDGFEWPSERTPKAATADKDQMPDPNQGAPIIVSIGPGGVMIASEDTKALDEFERLFTALAGSSMNGSANFTVFYLKHAKAEAVAIRLDNIFGGGTLQDGSGGGGGNILGDLAGSVMGEAGGGVVGSLLGMNGGGSFKASGSMKITPDPRLNAIIVQANSTDTDAIYEMLKVLDQKESPEDVLIAPKPRIIQLANTDAEKIAEIVKSTFQNRLESSMAAQGGNQPNPMQFIQMLRGGGGRRGGGNAGNANNEAADIERMTVTADTRTNSLIVAASDSLFQDVKSLVAQLDVTSEDAADGMKVISLHHASPEAVQAALQAIAGDNVQFSRSAGSSANNRSRTGPQSFGTPSFGQGGGRRNNVGGFNPQNFGGGGGFNPPNFGGGQNPASGNQGGGNRGGSGNRSGNRSGRGG